MTFEVPLGDLVVLVVAQGVENGAPEYSIRYVHDRELFIERSNRTTPRTLYIVRSKLYRLSLRGIIVSHIVQVP